MSYHIRVLQLAQSDIREIHRYISEDLSNPEAAVRRIKKIETLIRSLTNIPARLPLVLDDYLASKGLRMMVVKTHLVFFVIREDIKTVSVIRILYARRDWMRLLKIGVEQLFADDYA